MATTEVTIAIKANISDFKAKMKQAKQSVGDAKKGIEREGEKISKTVENIGGKSKLGDRIKQSLSSVTSSLGDLSPGLSKAQSTVEGLEDKFKKAGKAGKLAMAAVGIAVAGLAAGIAYKLGQAILDTTGKFAKLYDPVRYDQAMSRMEKSTKKLKTAIGALASPIFEWMSKAVSAIADAFTWLIEKIMAFVGILQGLFGISSKTNQSMGDMADSTEEASAAADAGLASFDKLNTLDVGEMGDMEEVAKIEEIMEEARKTGAKLRDQIMGIFDGLSWDSIVEGAVGLWDGFCEWGGNAWDWLCEKAGNIWTTITGFVGGLWNGFLEWGTNAWNTICSVAGTIWETIKGIASAVWDTITGFASAVWSGIQTIATTVWNVISSVASTVWNVISGVATAIWNGIQAVATTVWHAIESVATTVWNLISEPILALWNTFKEIGEKAWGALEKLGQKFSENIIDPIKGAVEWILDKVEWVLDKISGIKDFLGGAVDKVGNFFGGVADKVGGVLGFAEGGVFQPNSPQLVMMGDNKSEPEVAAPYSMIVNAVREAVSGMGGFGGGTIVVPVSIDGREVARASYDYLEIERARRGNIS